MAARRVAIPPNASLPQVGDTVSLEQVSVPDGRVTGTILGYVTRVNPAAEHPISVVEVGTAERNGPDSPSASPEDTEPHHTRVFGL